MTSISAVKHLRTRVETYLAGVFHPFPEERVIAGTIQQVARMSAAISGRSL
jgi:hypothetical protein